MEHPLSAAKDQAADLNHPDAPNSSPINSGSVAGTLVGPENAADHRDIATHYHSQSHIRSDQPFQPCVIDEIIPLWPPAKAKEPLHQKYEDPDHLPKKSESEIEKLKQENEKFRLRFKRNTDRVGRENKKGRVPGLYEQIDAMIAEEKAKNLEHEGRHK